ncbi:MAG: hypothetical protein LBM66_03015 [Bifidobacteriaceae bacterium]|nr:hypothetical protein [Bifidobacteriaceae bacterium]
MSYVDPIYEPAIFDGADAGQRLSVLGLDFGVLQEALDAGDIAARQPGKYHPTMAPGVERWLETVGRLRELLAARGWTSDDTRNVPRALSPDGLVALGVMSGTAAVGRAGFTPQAAHRRGPATQRAVDINQSMFEQLELNVEVLLADMAAERNAQRQSWFLLYHRELAGELRAEVSLPTAMDNGRVLRWKERIILPTIQFEPVVTPLVEGDNGDDEQSFEIRAL